MAGWMLPGGNATSQAINYGKELGNDAKHFMNDPYNTVSGAYDTASSGVSSAMDWLTNW